MNGRYLTLAGRIRRDLKDLETVVQRSKDICRYNKQILQII